MAHRLGSASLIATCFLAGPAAATTISYADAGLTFALKKIHAVDPAGIEIGAAAGLYDQDTLKNDGGNARSDYAAAVLGNPLSLGIGDGLRLGSSAWTHAIGPSGLGDAFTYTDGAITIRNGSNENARLRFVLSFDLAAAAGVDDPGLEAGYARASAGVESSSAGVLHYLFSEADSVFGPDADEYHDRIGVTVRLRPDQTETLYLVADTESQSVSLAPVPAPPGLALLLTALGALAARRRSLRR